MQASHRRIARNTLYLYIRMGFALCVKLYTSRVVLQTLGVMDYGLWSVVGGVISMIEVINASMAGCTNRFISYELGHGNEDSQQAVFSASMTIHLIISAIALVLAETLGLWFVETQLTIPDERMMACRIVYHLSVIGTMMSITQVPYNASIMAHERMDVFAFIDILNILLKLGIVYLIIVLPFDKLVSISVLNTLLGLSVLMIYRIYCLRRLPACHFALSHDWKRMRPMLSFSAWDMYGSMSVVFRTQGISVLLNMFFTAAMNAANGVATSLQSSIMAFANNVVTAFRPQIVKSYAIADYQRMNSLIQRAWTYTSVLLMLLMLPLSIEMDYVLRIWLVKPPVWAADFARLILLSNFFGNAITIVNIGIHATGNIKQLSFLNGTIYLLVLPVTWVDFSNGASPLLPFIYNACASILGLGLNVCLLHRLVPSFSRRTCASIFSRLSVVCALAVSVAYLITYGIEESFLRLVYVIAATSLVTIIVSWLVVFTVQDRQIIVHEARKRLHF